MKDFTPDQDEIGAEYDLSGSRPNPYAERDAEGTNLVKLDPDVLRTASRSRARRPPR